MKRYDLLNVDALPYRRCYLGTFATIADALQAIPSPIIQSDYDADHDAADAFAANGSLYVVERAQ
jgi:hypothetical protein